MTDISGNKTLMASLFHLELVKDREFPYEASAKTTESAASVLHSLLDRLPTEHMAVLYLNSGAEITGAELVGMGGIEQVGAHPAEVFRGAIVKAAPEIILAHNHPDGMVEPSTQDISYTLNLVELGAALGIRVRDHIIVGPNGKHHSIRENMDRLMGEMKQFAIKGDPEGMKKRLLSLLDPTGNLESKLDMPGVKKPSGDPKANSITDWEDSLSYKWLNY